MDLFLGYVDKVPEEDILIQLGTVERIRVYLL